jgi:hypothetical protein
MVKIPGWVESRDELLQGFHPSLDGIQRLCSYVTIIDRSVLGQTIYDVS